jgi:hypothetical protein
MNGIHLLPERGEKVRSMISSLSPFGERVRVRAVWETTWL